VEKSLLPICGGVNKMATVHNAILHKTHMSGRHDCDHDVENVERLAFSSRRH